MIDTVAPFPVRARHAQTARMHQRGLSLVELMIAITLGMVAVAGAISIYLANRSSYKLVEGAARVQENARFAVEFMGRDLREAGGVVCGGNLVHDNLLLASYPSATYWWSDWSTGLKGYASGVVMPARNIGNNDGDRASGTDALVVWSASTASPSQITAFNASTSTFTVYPSRDEAQGYVFTACDDARISTFKLNANATTAVVATPALTNAIKPGGFVNKLNASAWYVGKGSTASGALSLYRVGLEVASGGPNTSAQEILENVKNMQISYLQGDGDGAPDGTQYVDASAVTDWAKVLAVRVVLTLVTPDKVGVAATTGASNELTQDFSFTVALRRRLK